MQIQDIRVKKELQIIKNQVDAIFDESDDRETVEKISFVVSEKLEMLLNIIDWKE